MMSVNIDSSINMNNDRHAWMAAADAAALLGVSRTTLYAYVSRGRVRSQPSTASTRERVYSREDVERLQRRTAERHAPDKVAAQALQWGMPVLESSITLIDGRALFYRGLDAAMLARSRAIEEVAAFIWTGAFGRGRADGKTRPVERPLRNLPFTARAQSLLATASARDDAVFDLKPENVVRSGWRVIRLLVTAATGIDPGNAAAHAALAHAWQVDANGAEVLRTALVLCADHELNVSSFTARCVASAGAHPYAVVVAGLAALEGPRHGGAGARVESM